MQNTFLNRTALLLAFISLAILALLPQPSAAGSSPGPAVEQTVPKADKVKLPKCTYIASYAPGYEWQDRLESALFNTLRKQCEVQTFYMDSKKLNTESQLEASGLKAKQFIEQTQPDLVIVSDDNAVEYVLAPYFNGSSLPFIFCGVNNSGINYGLPYSNTTGMLEIAPVRQLLELLFQINPGKTHVAYLAGPGTTAAKNVAAFHQIVKEFDIPSSAFQARTQEDWRQLFKQLQEDENTDIILFDNFASFPQWDRDINLSWVKRYSKKLTVTNSDWVMPYVMLGLANKPEEQGTWAGLSAIHTLNGMPINRQEVVANNSFVFWYNPTLIQESTSPLPSAFLMQAQPYESKESELDE
ncbi:ABC transporter substrate-binding protein [Thiomicrorhabdus sp. 6S3-12]|uniref:ABC transporter substrate-binding protein n=1 Tax=Thiomicrorhabdus sp. 6S3-12 TaxID=2819681 RepID=UPI001AACA820|nr:hypothetical protein [Thiomicrorhabdus sp. 6S3-12]MBO1925099.1 hypothetical protein [Thiomicrorhabdus sp. 6S3-12]